jgi:hypothetical protein
MADEAERAGHLGAIRIGLVAAGMQIPSDGNGNGYGNGNGNGR